MRQNLITPSAEMINYSEKALSEIEKVKEAVEVYEAFHALLDENPDKFAMSKLNFHNRDGSGGSDMYWAATDAVLDSVRYSISISMDRYLDRRSMSEREEVNIMRPAQPNFPAEQSTYYGYNLVFEHNLEDQEDQSPQSLGRTQLPSGDVVEVIVNKPFSTIDLMEALELLTRIRSEGSLEIPDYCKGRPTYKQFKEWLLKKENDGAPSLDLN